jgi:hypothetical protein
MAVASATPTTEILPPTTMVINSRTVEAVIKLWLKHVLSDEEFNYVNVVSAPMGDSTMMAFSNTNNDRERFWRAAQNAVSDKNSRRTIHTTNIQLHVLYSVSAELTNMVFVKFVISATTVTPARVL